MLKTENASSSSYKTQNTMPKISFIPYTYIIPGFNFA